MAVARMEHVPRLLRVVVIVEGRVGILEIDEAFCTRRKLSAVLGTDMDNTRHGATDGAWMREPLARCRMRQPNGLRAAIVFMDDWPPPFEHLVLDRPRTGRRGMNGHPVRSQASGGALRD